MLGSIFNARFGTWRGWVRLQLSRGASLLGRYNRFRHVDWTRVERVVFICRGNICRSAIAQARARQIDLPVAGFGLRTETGRRSPDSAIEAADRIGLDLSGHHAVDLTDFDILPGDLLVPMEPGQARGLVPLTEAKGAQLALMGYWLTPQRPHLHDPYTLSAQYFDTCFRLIADGVEKMETCWNEARRDIAATGNRSLG